MWSCIIFKLRSSEFLSSRATVKSSGYCIIRISSSFILIPKLFGSFFNVYEIKFNKTDIRHPCVIPFVILNVLDNHSLPFMLNLGFLYDISTHLRNWSIILNVFQYFKKKAPFCRLKSLFIVKKLKYAVFVLRIAIFKY